MILDQHDWSGCFSFENKLFFAYNIRVGFSQLSYKLITLKKKKLTKISRHTIKSLKKYVHFLNNVE